MCVSVWVWPGRGKGRCRSQGACVVEPAVVSKLLPGVQIAVREVVVEEHGQEGAEPRPRHLQLEPAMGKRRRGDGGRSGAGR